MIGEEQYSCTPSKIRLDRVDKHDNEKGSCAELEELGIAILIVISDKVVFQDISSLQTASLDKTFIKTQ